MLSTILAIACLSGGLVGGLPEGARGGGGEEGDSSRYERRWFYASSNLQVERNADELIGLMERGAKAGYNGVVLADYKLGILDRVAEHYFPNARRVREAGERLGLTIAPAVFPIGYSSSLLAHDVNLAEGMPVVDAPFVVKGSEASLAGAEGELLRNGGLEEVIKGDVFAGFSFQDDPGAATFADAEVKHGGSRSCRVEGGSSTGNRRLIQRVKVRPFACYRFSVSVKTDGLEDPGAFYLRTIAAGEKGRNLSFFEGGVAGTQDWKEVSIVFNSLEATEVGLYAGLWGGGAGRLWMDDLRLSELGLVNVLRRKGCPLRVTSEDKATVYEEGRDFEEVVDAKLGAVPYAGEYDFDHAGPTIRLKGGSRMREGQRISVSWYHPVIVHNSQVMCCPSEPKVVELLWDQARRVRDLFEPTVYFMSHDEIRCLNWDRSCLDRKLTPGEILAENARLCESIVKEVSPGAEVVVWSDMFDPHHNAKADYYLVNGDLSGSWEGLSPRVVIANWNGGKKRESLEFFAGRGHRQILAGYYDADDLSGFTGWDEAAKGVRGADGFLYTTWQHKYSLLEEYGRAMGASRD